MFIRKKKDQSRGLSIIIVGGGKVGMTLCERLSEENHDVTLIDRNPDVVANITNLYDIYGVVGNGASFNTQMEAGIEKADILIAVTGSDELNILCCVVAKQNGNCDVIARVSTPEYSEESTYLKSRLELAMIINPEMEAAREISRILYLPTAIGVSSFARGQAEMVRFKVPAGNMLHGKKIRNLSSELSGAVLICAVEREEDVYIPDGNFELREGDVLSFISPVRDAKTFLKRVGFKTHAVKDTMIIGGGKVALYLARRLLRLGIRVTIIEQDKSRCEELSIEMPDAIVINADGTDADVLKENGFEEAESFVPLTGIDEENILLTLHAKEETNAKLITKINHISFDKVIHNLDLGSVIYPKYITSEALVAFVRAKTAGKDTNIETLVHMYDDRVEAIEFVAGEDPDIIGKPLAQLKSKSQTLIACINRKGHILIPGGNDTIEIGDSVIIVTKNRGFKNLHDILE